jgi:hypothetical protein
LAGGVGGVDQTTKRRRRNTYDALVIDPRPGGATSDCAEDNIAVLDLAVSQLRGLSRTGC